MTTNSLHFQIEQLRAQNLQKTMEAIFVILAALFVSALLPSLLIQYVYANQQLMEEPRLLQFIPMIAFIYGAGFGLKAVFGNMMRELTASRLEAEVMRSESPMTAPRSSTTDLQVALSRVESAHTRTSKAKTNRAKKTKARRK